jgi:copper chaperone CopZ
MGTEGILGVAVSYSVDSIKVEYDPELLSEKRIVAAIRKMGLKPRESTAVNHPSKRRLP